MFFKPFLRACGPLRGGGSESESDLEPDWDSEPDRAGRGFSSSESLSAIFFSDPEPESESEFDEAFCIRTDKKGLKKCFPRKSATYIVTEPMDHLLLPSPSGFLCPSPSRLLLWREILLAKVFSLGSGTNRKLSVCVGVPGRCSCRSRNLTVWALTQTATHSRRLDRWRSRHEPFSEREAAERKEREEKQETILMTN